MPLDPDALVSQVRDADDSGLLIARLTLEELRRSDPPLAAAYTVAALPRRFDAKIIDVLLEATSLGASDAEAFARLAQLSEVRRHRDGRYTLHDSVRAPLLRHWRAEEGLAELWAAAHQRLAEHLQNRHQAARIAEDQLAATRTVISEADGERYLQISQVVSLELAAPLVEAVYHATIADGEAGRLMLIAEFNRNGAEGRPNTCSALVESFAEGVAQGVADAGERRRLEQWAEYLRARLRVFEEEFDAAEQALERLGADEVVDPVLRMWVLDELGRAARGLFQFDRARTRFRQAVDERRRHEIDLWNLPLALSWLGGCHDDLWDDQQAIRIYEESLAEARELGNRPHEFSTLASLARLHALHGKPAEAAGAIIDALHLARTDPQLRLRAAIGHTLAVGAMRVLVKLDQRQAETAYQEARALVRPEAVDELVVLDDNYLDELIDVRLLARASQIEALIRKNLPRAPSHVAARFLVTAGRALTNQGLAEDALGVHDEILALQESARVEPWQVAAARTNAALAQLDTGRLDAAEQSLDAARTVWEAMGHERGQAFVSVYQADLARRRGDLDRAERLVRAGEVFSQTGAFAETDFLTVRARILHARGQWAQAAGAAERAAAVMSARAVHHEHANVLAEWAGACARAADYVSAARAASALADATALLARQAEWLPDQHELRADRDAAAAMIAVVTRTSNRTAALEGASEQLKLAMAADPGPFWYPLNLAYVEWELGNTRAKKRAIDAAAQRAAGSSFAEPIRRVGSQIQ